MSTFIRYPSLVKLGNVEVEGIELGETHVFPKIDGTNSSIWIDDGDVFCGSRNRILTLDNDNAGFANAILASEYGERYREFLAKYPDLRIYGEWLVPHTLTGYRDDAWRKLYVFDILDQNTGQFIRYEEYLPKMHEFELDFIPCYKIIRNGDAPMYMREAKEIRYLLKDEQAHGEGVVIKNYGYTNKFNRVTWAKYVTSEFKETHVSYGDTPSCGTQCNEEIVVDKCVTMALVEKEYAKITNEKDWENKDIPRLLETVFYCLVTEELYSALKDIKQGAINFKVLKQFCYMKTKNLKPELF
jgi:hypothetical protein